MPLKSDSSSFIFETVFLPIILVAVLCAVGAVILIVIKKNRIENLRHHLMPVYNFDASEDGEDWETELLDDGFAKSQISYSNSLPQSGVTAGLKLDTGLTSGLNVKNVTNCAGLNAKNEADARKSPTASSGLLSSRNVTNTLYTNEKPIV
ncbi:uncharacterized protein B4U80_04843 [Leptotrombidium deliense]|uniref:Uncharacterized protein n=1 Tax=Leptotrombidium deliense TaxID=299467 RepID=A0A443SVI4_9ACAR|nr:uncharacterized protein B4U80_04843 [Leptotrombidium deliense]